MDDCVVSTSAGVHTDSGVHDDYDCVTLLILQIPLKGFANTGLSSGPGGTEYNDRYVTR